MEIVFPDIPIYQGWGKPLRTESTVEGLELIEGHIPAGLNGTWYRAGPDRQFPSNHAEDIFIDGEGMMHMLRIEGDFVTYKSRWTRTARFLAQQKARKGLFGRYRNPFTALPEAKGVHHGTGNTNMIYHAGKLYILREDDLPYEVDPDTLETGPRTDMEGQIDAVTLSAHPKLDLVRNEYLTYSNQARGDGSQEIVIYIFDAAGKLKNRISVEGPWAGVIHDFAITEQHIIIPCFPLITDMDVVRQGGTFYQWHPDKPTMVAVLSRDGDGSDIRWFKGPTSSAGHMLNAVTEGDKVKLDLCLYHGNCFPFFKTPDGDVTEPVPPLLSRMTFDLASDSEAITIDTICQVPSEMPRTDDRYQGRSYRYGYMVTGRKPDGSSTIGRINVETGELLVWQHEQLLSASEGQFVPKAPDAPEGDGWLLVLLNRLDLGHSELAIFDAQAIPQGPVARLHIPVRIRSTFHGSWVPEATFSSHRYDMQAP